MRTRTRRKMKKLTINVCADFLFEYHNINANEEGRPKEVDGKTSFAGQKCKNSMIEKMKDFVTEDGVNISISTGDSVTGDIVNDIRSDLGGYMITTKAENGDDTKKKSKKKKGDEEIEEDGDGNKSTSGTSDKRVSPLKVAYAVAREGSSYFDDLFVCFSHTDDKSDQRINNKNYSIRDMIDINSQLYIDEVGRKKEYKIVDNQFKGEYGKLLITEEEKLARLEYYLLASVELKNLANFSRNATYNTPNKVFISFAEDRTFIKYFQMTEKQRHNYIKYLEPGSYFYGDDDSDFSVKDAVYAAIDWMYANIDKLSI